MKSERTKNALRNTAWGAALRLTTLFGPFAVKTILIRRLGLEYNGLNALFQSILTLLNLANLGFSGAVVYTMYDAVARKDDAALCALLHFFRRIYWTVGLVILCLGLLLLPFLPLLVGAEAPPGADLRQMFGLYLAATVLEYIPFGYVTALFSAHQREDLRLRLLTGRYLLQYALQILLLTLLNSSVAYLWVLPLLALPNGAANYWTARRHYPTLRCVGQPEVAVKGQIYRRVRTLFGHKVGNTLLVSADSLLIAAALGLSVQARYSNYYYILTAVNGLAEIFTGGILSGIGNKLIADSREENHRLFRTLSCGWALLIGFFAACLLCLYQPFVSGIWIGPEGLLGPADVAWMTLFFYAWMIRLLQLTYRDAAGLWTRDWLKPYLGAALKLCLSLLLLRLTGSLVGVLLPTVLVLALLYFPWEAWVLHRELFGQSMADYLRQMCRYTLLNACGAALALGGSLYLAPEHTQTAFFLRMIPVCLLFPLPWLGAMGKEGELRAFLRLLLRLVNRAPSS